MARSLVTLAMFPVGICLAALYIAGWLWLTPVVYFFSAEAKS